MGTSLYDKLADMNVLRRAWHLARDDSRTDFMFDSFRFADFGFRLDEYLLSISRSLKNESYHPQPLLTIDVPKSSLSVRPGSILSIEDKIVLFGIACLIAPRLDKKLPPNVYSWRVKDKPRKLFHDHQVLKYPFLKRKTIHRRLDIVEPWYAAWPAFVKDVEIAYEAEGYRYMVVSDIVAYFENIDLHLLRDLLLHNLPKQPKIINFLIKLLEYWAWPTVHDSPVYRGIPQGNGVSSFLGNFYLLPLDQAFVRLARRRDIKYLRYMDDVRVLAKDPGVAREVLFLMNEKLRELRLNIQGYKTRILEDSEIRNEFFDDRLDEVNRIIDEIEKKQSLSRQERKDYEARLKNVVKKVKGKSAVIKDKELRLFRRLMTAYTLIQHSGMVRAVLTQLEKNPDARLLNSAIRYFRTQERTLKRISDQLLELISCHQPLFDYQQAHFFMMMRYVRDIPMAAWKEARRILGQKRSHWYVRQQAAQLLSIKCLSKRELTAVQRRFAAESHVEVKKALCQALAQLPVPACTEFAHGLVFSTEPALQKIGRFYYGLLVDEKGGQEQVQSIFRYEREDILLDCIYQVELLSKANSNRVRQLLMRKLQDRGRKVRRTQLKRRIEKIMERLESDN